MMSFTAHMFGINREDHFIRELAIYKLRDMKQHSQQDPSKLRQIELVLNFLEKKTNLRGALVSAVLLDMNEKDPLFLKVICKENVKLSKEDIALLVELNPALTRLTANTPSQLRKAKL